MKKKSVLIVSAGIMQIPAIQKAKELGFHVIATDKNPEAPGFEFSDYFAVIDSKDIDGHINFVGKHQNLFNICGVFAASDVAVTVAAIANYLNLPSISNEVAIRSHNKALMKQKWIEDGIPTPLGFEIKNINQIKNIIDKLNFPLIVKPVDNAASRGSKRIDNLNELDNAVTIALNFSRTGTAIIEEYVTGYEQSVETIIFEGKHYHVGMADREFGFHPYHIETAHVDPSQLPLEQQEKIYEVVDAAAKSLGINFGPAKADMIWTDKGPMILEMTARLSGGFHSQYTTPMSTGQDPIKAVLELCVGNNLNTKYLEKTKSNVVICSGVFPKPGKIIRIDGLDKLHSVTGFEKIILNKNIGNHIYEYIDNGNRFCWLFNSSNNLERARLSFKACNDLLNIIVD